MNFSRKIRRENAAPVDGFDNEELMVMFGFVVAAVHVVVA